MAKAIVLTYAEVNKEEKKLLKNTDVFKIACNTYCADLKPNVRITLDDIVDKCLECDTCPVISVNHDLEKADINGSWLPKRHSSLLSCLDYLYLEGYDDVLLIATNPKGKPTYLRNLDGVKFMKKFLNIYKYSSEGTFDVPTMTVKEFIMLTDEEKVLLGVKEQRQKNMYEETIFTEFCRYEVHTEGRNNKSVEGGNIVKSILPPEEQQRLLNGENEIIYNGLVIKKLTELTPKKAVNDDKILEQVQNDNKKVEPEKMTYQELLDYVKKNNIKAKTNKKADLIAAIKG